MSPAALPADAVLGIAPSVDRVAALALSLVDGVGPVKYRAWAGEHGSAETAFRARVASADRDRALALADDALARAARIGATLLLVGDTGYPTALLELPDPPPALWCLGNAVLLDESRTRAAVVGTRAMSAYGARAAAAVCEALAAAGAVVVSGMALGIDGVAHASALRTGGTTVAVLGSGVDVAYPRAHARLHARIARDGLVLSEAAPGGTPNAGAFPRRNRIIAALSRATVVIEAGVRSGALITATVALELGRDVAAVPGPIDSQESAGTNALLRDGAVVIAEPRDAVALVGLADVATPQPARRAEPVELGADERAVWDALATAAPDLDTLVTRAGLPTDRCLAALTTLELSGHVECANAGDVRRR